MRPRVPEVERPAVQPAPRQFIQQAVVAAERTGVVVRPRVLAQVVERSRRIFASHDYLREIDRTTRRTNVPERRRAEKLYRRRVELPKPYERRGAHKAHVRFAARKRIVQDARRTGDLCFEPYGSPEIHHPPQPGSYRLEKGCGDAGREVSDEPDLVRFASTIGTSYRVHGLMTCSWLFVLLATNTRPFAESTATLFGCRTVG